MDGRIATSVDARGERRALIALVALFALLVQALFADAAMAAASRFDPDSAICSVLGGKAKSGAPAPAPNSHDCGHCLGAGAAMQPPPDAYRLERVAYFAERGAQPPPPERRIPPARAPPRPFGQGPPNAHA